MLFQSLARLAALRSARFTGAPITSRGRTDIDAMLAAVSDRTKLIFVSSPHNPTGAVVDEDEIVRFEIDRARPCDARHGVEVEIGLVVATRDGRADGR